MFSLVATQFKSVTVNKMFHLDAYCLIALLSVVLTTSQLLF